MGTKWYYTGGHCNRINILYETEAEARESLKRHKDFMQETNQVCKKRHILKRLED